MNRFWREPRYYTGEGDVWNLHEQDNADMHWQILGSITYLGLTRRENWGDRLQRWRIDRKLNEPQVIEVKSLEEAKAVGLSLLVLS